MPISADETTHVLRQLAETPRRLATMTACLENAQLYDKHGEDVYKIKICRIN